MYMRSATWILVLAMGCTAPSQRGDDALVVPLQALPNLCELPVASQQPLWLRDAVGYQVWVRSFADSDGDGAGDLRGLRKRLDYLNDGKPGGDDLGVDVLWLSPIFPSPSDHGYDATDYRSINPDYGDAAEFKALIDAAHQRGIKVVLDLVLNHCSRQHPWFQEAASSPDSAKRAWFSWRDSDPGWTQPWGKAKTWHKLTEGQWYYGLFWQGMPDLNVAHAPVTKTLQDIAVFWAEQGVDGYRLDAARYLVETGPGPGQVDTEATHEFWRGLRKRLDALRPGIALLGEVWTKTQTVATYLKGDELHGAFDFDGCAGLRKGIELSSPSMWRSALCKSAEAHGGHWVRFAGNHDMARLADIASTLSQRKRALATVLLSPGVPWIYQGDELGLPSGSQGGDRRYRLPMPWTDEGPSYGFTTTKPWMTMPTKYGPLAVSRQLNEPTSLLRLVMQAVAIRKSIPSITNKPASILELDDAFHLDVDGDVLVVAYGRRGLAGSAILMAPLQAGIRLPQEVVAGATQVFGAPTASLDGQIVLADEAVLWRW